MRPMKLPLMLMFVALLGVMLLPSVTEARGGIQQVQVVRPFRTFVRNALPAGFVAPQRVVSQRFVQPVRQQFVQPVVVQRQQPVRYVQQFTVQPVVVRQAVTQPVFVPATAGYRVQVQAVAVPNCSFVR